MQENTNEKEFELDFQNSDLLLKYSIVLFVSLI